MIILTVYSSFQWVGNFISGIYRNSEKCHYETKIISKLANFWKFVGKSHLSCKFLGHSRPSGLLWPKNWHSRWRFSPLIFQKSRDRKSIISGLFFVHISCHLFYTVKNIVVNCDTWIESRPFRSSSPTKGFLSWLGALRWHGPSRCHPRKLPRTRL